MVSVGQAACAFWCRYCSTHRHSSCRRPEALLDSGRPPGGGFLCKSGGSATALLNSAHKRAGPDRQDQPALKSLAMCSRRR